MSCQCVAFLMSLQYNEQLTVALAYEDTNVHLKLKVSPIHFYRRLFGFSDHAVCSAFTQQLKSDLEVDPRGSALQTGRPSDIWAIDFDTYTVCSCIPLCQAAFPPTNIIVLSRPRTASVTTNTVEADSQEGEEWKTINLTYTTRLESLCCHHHSASSAFLLPFCPLVHTRQHIFQWPQVFSSFFFCKCFK